MRIHRLDEALIRRIAAGEVVDRPASVVKELVENALDAEAEVVEISLRGGGIGEIVVADDGVGMTPEELPLAVERHTTSKIRREEDLLSIATLGFRGEALAAICAVARVRVISRPRGAQEAYELSVEGGRKGVVRPAARREGTTVEVRDLFFNTPVRRKFLRSPRAEARHSLAVLRALALGHPGIRFQVSSEGRDVFSFPAAEDPLGRIAQIYGRRFASQLLAVELEGQGYVLRAYLGPPELQRPTRSEQYLFVSGRAVIPGSLGAYVEELYRRYLPRGAHPVFFLYLDVDPLLVDVNVHPKKEEVRFRNEAAVKDLLRRAVQRALGTVPVRVPIPGSQGESEEGTPLEFLPYSRGRDWRVLGQVRRSFILVETPEGLEIVDQHVAHERVLFERYDGTREIPTHLLLVPLPLELPPDAAAALGRLLPELRRLGVLLEPFGKKGFLLRGWPAPLVDKRKLSFREPLEVVAQRALEGKELPLVELWRELACASAIKAGEELSLREQEALITEWKRTKEPARCPHGRPTVLKLGWRELERLFGRSTVVRER